MGLPAKRFNDDTIETLTTYLQEGGDSSGIILTDKQKEIFDRARFADEKIRENRYSKEEVANFLKCKYGISRDTAYKAIVIAEAIFSSSYPLNKQYEIGLRIEFLKKKINDLWIDEDAFNAAALEKQLREYIKMYPEYKATRSPKNITYVLQQNIHTTNITVEQAAEEAEKLLIQLKEKEDY